MKRVYVNEDWCLACHLCEYYCAAANSGAENMIMGMNDAWVVTLDASSRIPFLTYSARRDLREQLYKAYIDRCNEGSEYDNRSLVNDFARLRNEKARLLGYPSYAAYVTADQMAGTPAAV